MQTPETARAEIAALIAKYRALDLQQKREMTEASIVHQFINPLLRALGWPVEDPQQFKYELQTTAGRPDMTLFLSRSEPLFVEAKRFDIIKPLDLALREIVGVVKPDQMTLPGVATDRTREEQQAINYAFENGATWAILTNFEKLRLFNARRDWLVLSFERPSAYLEEFDLLWQLAHPNLQQNALESLSQQRVRADVDTDYLNFINVWRERLAQDILNHPAENQWAWDEHNAVRLADLRAVVQRLLDRLVVVRYAEDHLVVPAGTLQKLYELRRLIPIYTDPLGAYINTLFRRFDEEHNSALFASHLLDQAHFSDGAMLELVSQLYERRFRAMTADIIGNTYEQYLGKTLDLEQGAIITRDNLETRKKQGSYYTPQVIVQYLVDHSLGRYLYGTTDGRPAGPPAEGERRKTVDEIADLRVLDPSCGSGGFLIYAYQVLAEFYRGEISRVHAARQQRFEELKAAGRISPMDLQIELTIFEETAKRLADYPRIILETHLYGVDLDPQAAEIAVVNLMMRAIADQERTKKRLPLLLNQNIKVGNSLIGALPGDPRLTDHRATLADLHRLRVELARGGSSEHKRTLDAIAAAQMPLQAELDAPLAAHFANVEAVRAFHWAVEFPEVFVDAHGQPLPNAGFQIIIGNPPWEIVKPDLREFYAQFDPDIESKLTRAKAEQRIAELNAQHADYEPRWQAQVARTEAAAQYFRACPDYTRQGRGDTATHKLFLERAYAVLPDGGRLAFVVPSGLYSDLGTKELRQMLLTEGQIDYLFSFSNERFFFPGVHHSFKFTLLGAQKGATAEGFWAAFRFNPRVAVAPADLPAFLANRANLIYLRVADIAKFSPDSLSVMEFQSQSAYEITEAIYGTWPLLGEQRDDTWNIKLTAEFHMTNDRDLFNIERRGLPLYEGKMLWHFDSFYAEPQFWVEEPAGQARAERKSTGDYQLPRLGFRDVASATNERTLISSVLPPRSFAGNTINLALVDSPYVMFYVQAMLNSLCLDFVTRPRMSTHVNIFTAYQLPLPRLTPGHPVFDGLVARALRLTCSHPAFADLWQQVAGTPWSPDQAATTPAERQRLRDEIDAMVAHLFGLSRAQFEHILGTFPLVFPPTPEGQAKKAALLAEYDRQAGRSIPPGG